MREIALDLDYSEILKLCRSSKKLNSVCNDPNFWRMKIKSEYPNLDISRLKGPELKARYEKLLIDYLRENATLLEEEMEEEITNEIFRIQEKYGKRINNMLDNIRLLEERIEGKLPDYLNVNYFPILLPPAIINNIKRRLVGGTVELETFLGILDRYHIELHDTIKTGDLIGLVDKNKDYYGIPKILIYVYTIGYEDKPDVEYISYVETENGKYPETLIQQIKEEGYNTSDIPSIYNLPFDIESEFGKQQE